MAQCVTCGRIERFIVDEVDECRDPQNRNGRRCLFVQMQAARGDAAPPSVGIVQPPSPVPPPHDGHATKQRTPPLDPHAQIAALEQSVRSLKDELLGEKKRHESTAEEAQTHKTWATELFAEVSVLKRKLEDPAPPAPLAPPPPDGPRTGGGADPSTGHADSRAGLTAAPGVFASLRALAARAPVRFGGMAAVIGAMLAAVVMTFLRAANPPVVPVVNPPTEIRESHKARLPKVEPPSTSANVTSAGGTAESNPGTSGTAAAGPVSEPVRPSVDIVASGVPTNDPKTDAKTKPSFDRAAALTALRQALESNGLTGLDVRASASGRVSLAGVVASESQKDRAASIARAQPGVRDVANAITVRTPEPTEPVQKTARDTTPLHAPPPSATRNLLNECEAGTNFVNRTMKSYLCMKKLCKTPDLASHPQCKEFCDKDRSAC